MRQKQAEGMVANELCTLWAIRRESERENIKLMYI